MKCIGIVALALAACGAHPSQPTPTSQPVTPSSAPAAPGESKPSLQPPAPEVAIATRPAGAAPGCSAADLHAAGTTQPLRIVDGCPGNWDVLARLGGDRPGMWGAQQRATSDPRLVMVRNDPSVWAIEARSSAELGKLAGCSVHVDWSQDHAWVVVYEAEDAGVSVGSILDDGAHATLGLDTDEKGCGGAAPRTEHAFTVVVVPAAREVALARCVSQAPAHPCTGLEK